MNLAAAFPAVDILVSWQSSSKKKKQKTYHPWSERAEVSIGYNAESNLQVIIKVLAVAVNSDRLTHGFDASLCSGSQAGSRLPLCQCACMSTFRGGGEGAWWGASWKRVTRLSLYCSLSFEMENARILVSVFCFPNNAPNKAGSCFGWWEELMRHEMGNAF